MNKTIAIYHRADFDGLFCREIVRKFLPDAELIGWDYGDSDAIIPPGVDKIYMLDISVEAWMKDPRLVWIDHHKSAIDKFDKTIPGFRLDGVAACRLAWQWFTLLSEQGVNVSDFPRQIAAQLPSKKDFEERRVSEPLAVRLAGEYDIWDKRDPDAELFQHGLRSVPMTDGLWEELLEPQNMPHLVGQLLQNASILQYAKGNENESIIRTYGFDVEFEGLTFLACNHARFNSQLFDAGVRPEHDALLGFNWNGPKKEWRVSLYHAPGKEHHDLSLIAVKYGGGGHRGACGFRIASLPFLP